MNPRKQPFSTSSANIARNLGLNAEQKIEEKAAATQRQPAEYKSHARNRYPSLEPENNTQNFLQPWQFKVGC